MMHRTFQTANQFSIALDQRGWCDVAHSSEMSDKRELANDIIQTAEVMPMPDSVNHAE
jgi:hypothetical protein